MKIQVTEEDILRGKGCGAFFCPIARAINRHLAEDYYVSVGTYSGINIRDPFGYIVENIPHTPESRTFVDRVDNSLAVQPCELELAIPEEYLRNGL